MLHDGCNPSLHISFPLSLFKKSEVFCRSVVAARRIASDDRRKSQRAQISPTGGWRCAKCRVELGVHTDDYGQQRTETDNTDDRPAGVQNKPYLHKPRKRRYPQTTIRLSGFSRTIGATASGFRSGALSRRYPRVLQAKRPGSVLAYVTRALSAARLAGASENAPCYNCSWTMHLRPVCMLSTSAAPVRTA